MPLPITCLGDPTVHAVSPGAVTMGNPLFLVNGRPAATVGMPAAGVPPGVITVGMPDVLICGMPVAVMGMPHSGGGTVTAVDPTAMA